MAIPCHLYSDRLQRRRSQIEMTLAHLATERQTVVENARWMDQAAYRSRMSLFDRLTAWYREEMKQIEGALKRIQSGRYGLCIGCNKIIPTERLDASPEAELCPACEAHGQLRRAS